MEAPTADCGELRLTGLGVAVASSAHAFVRERFNGGVKVSTVSIYLVCVRVSFYLE